MALLIFVLVFATGEPASALNVSIWGPPNKTSCNLCMKQCSNGETHSPPLDCDLKCPEVCVNGIKPDSQPSDKTATANPAPSPSPAPPPNQQTYCNNAMNAAQTACNNMPQSYNPPSGSSCGDIQSAASNSNANIQSAASSCSSAIDYCISTCNDVGSHDGANTCDGLHSRIQAMQNQLNNNITQAQNCGMNNPSTSGGVSPQSATQPQQTAAAALPPPTSSLPPNSAPATSATNGGGSNSADNTKPSFPQSDPGAFPGLGSGKSGSATTQIDNSANAHSSSGFADSKPAMRGNQPPAVNGMPELSGGRDVPPSSPSGNRPSYYQKPATTAVLSGERGGGGGSGYAFGTTPPQNPEPQENRSPASRALLARQGTDKYKGLDLRKYLPGEQRDPHRLSGAASLHPDIHPATDILWQGITDRMHVHCYLKQLYGCQ